jgi:hypothetical protein
MPFHPILGLGALALVGLALARRERLYVVEIDTYEAGDFPILSHTFRGRTRAEAWRYVAAHMKTDAFFRGCAAGHFADFDCRNVTSREGWK